MSAPTLRPYQRDVLDRLKAEIAGGRRRICLVAPTGSGKTVIAAAIIADAVARGDRVVFVAHRRELTEQTSQKLHAVRKGTLWETNSLRPEITTGRRGPGTGVLSHGGGDLKHGGVSWRKTATSAQPTTAPVGASFVSRRRHKK